MDASGSPFSCLCKNKTYLEWHVAAAALSQAIKLAEREVETEGKKKRLLYCNHWAMEV